MGYRKHNETEEERTRVPVVSVSNSIAYFLFYPFGSIHSLLAAKERLLKFYGKHDLDIYFLKKKTKFCSNCSFSPVFAGVSSEQSYYILSVF